MIQKLTRGSMDFLSMTLSQSLFGVDGKLTRSHRLTHQLEDLVWHDNVSSITPSCDIFSLSDWMVNQ